MNYLIILIFLGLSYFIIFDNEPKNEVKSYSIVQKNYLTSIEAETFCNEKENKFLATRSQIDKYYEKNKKLYKNDITFFYAKDGSTLEDYSPDSLTILGYLEYNPKTKETTIPINNRRLSNSPYTLCVEVITKGNE